MEEGGHLCARYARFIIRILMVFLDEFELTEAEIVSGTSRFSD